MSIEKSKAKLGVSRHYLPILAVEDSHGLYVDSIPVNHGNLDSLIGRLMNMFELNGDVTQREAQKIASKNICRDWLDNEYDDLCGYKKYYGEMPGGQVLKIDRYQSISEECK